MASPLVRWLAARSTGELATILANRPDTLDPPDMADLGVLASRLQMNLSVHAAMETVGPLAVQVVEAMAALGGPSVRPDRLAWALARPLDTAGTAAALRELAERALVWPDEETGELRMAGALWMPPAAADVVELSRPRAELEALAERLRAATLARLGPVDTPAPRTAVGRQLRAASPHPADLAPSSGPNGQIGDEVPRSAEEGEPVPVRPPLLWLVPDPPADAEPPAGIGERVRRHAEQLSPSQQRLLARAIRTGEPVRIDYHDSDGGRSTRVVEPRELDRDRLTAWCRLREAERRFALDRIDTVAPAD